MERRLCAILEKLGPEPREPAETLAWAIGEIDRRVHAQLDAILHAAAFQELEATWTSLEVLLTQSPPRLSPDRPPIKIRVLNVSRREIQEDLADAVEFDRSTLFRRLYEDEFGRFGGEPYAIVVADYQFSQDPEDIEILHGLAGIAAAAHMILLAGASPTLLDLDRWSELSTGTDLKTLGEANDQWRRLRLEPDTRYVGLVLPRVLLRLPYRPTDPDRYFRYREDAFAANGSGRLWGNAAFVLALRAMDAFDEYSWCTAIRGLEGGGIVRGLPEDGFGAEREGLVVRPPVEVSITEDKEKALTDLGLIPLCRVSGTSIVAFFGVPSLHLAKPMENPATSLNLRLSAQIPYMLAACRFAHHIKVMMRAQLGLFMQREQCERRLGEWLARYTLQDDQATKEKQREFPLRESSVTVRPKPGKPGELQAFIDLRPHYQLEEASVTLRIVTDLPEEQEKRT